MSEEYVLTIAREAILTALYVAAPLLLLSLLVGLGISIFQATTQIQEQTLSIVPKIVAIYVGIIFFGNWMLSLMISITTKLFTRHSMSGLYEQEIGETQWAELILLFIRLTALLVTLRFFRLHSTPAMAKIG